MTRVRVVLMFMMLVGVCVPAALASEQPCEVVPMPCTFEGRPFTVKVIDGETRQPVADVHVLAEWQIWGPHGRNGPLMVQDGITDRGGVVKFPAWGPIQGPGDGLIPDHDPVVSFFKPGYLKLAVYNAAIAKVKQRVRTFAQNTDAVELWPFRGSLERWAEEISKVAGPEAAPTAIETILPFREPYLNRLRRVRTELEALPEPLRSQARRRMPLDWFLRGLEEGAR